MLIHLLIVAVLLAATGAVLIGVCCWPARRPRRRAGRSTAPVTGPRPGGPPRRGEFTLGA
jgi:uncharacterized iron-regulated membrane protein